MDENTAKVCRSSGDWSTWHTTPGATTWPAGFAARGPGSTTGRPRGGGRSAQNRAKSSHQRPAERARRPGRRRRTTSTITVVGHSEQPRARLIVGNRSPMTPDGCGSGHRTAHRRGVAGSLSHAPEAGGAWSAWNRGSVPAAGPRSRGRRYARNRWGGQSARLGHAQCSRPRMRSSSPPMSARSTRPRRCRFIRQANGCAATLVVGTKTDLSDGGRWSTPTSPHLRRGAPI